MRIAVLASGGDGPGMNAALRAVVRTAVGEGDDVLGVRDGFEGLLRGDLEAMDRGAVSGIIERGGCVLGTARSPVFRTPEGRARAAATLREHRIDGVVAIGGNGTAAGAEVLAREHDVAVMVVPGSIDNDVVGSDESIGFNTAANTALDAIDRIRDTADALRRIFFIEVMGRASGALALHVGVAGGADAILVPELPCDRDELIELVRGVAGPHKRSTLVVVAEGETPGGAFAVAKSVGAAIEREYRVQVLGYIQRGGRPSVRDRVLACELGLRAVEALREGHVPALVGRIRDEVTLTPLAEVAHRTRRPPVEYLRLAQRLSR